jgi:GxxExxY protein
MEPSTHTNEYALLYKDKVFQIIASALEILNTLGCGLLEKPYENALAVEFKIRNMPFHQQKRFTVTYKSVEIGEYKADLIVFDKIIVEIKTVERITNIERAQLINYLKITGLQLGIILNFKHSILEWERIIFCSQ